MSESESDGYIYDSVLPALTAKVQNFIVFCNQEGLKIEGHSYHNNVQKYLPLLEPIRRKNNRILKNQPVVESQPLKW
ncbi:hypothetical protein GLAREA_03487 [Glarea lozoyensis ATCC 20868]|uniref:Uncharacterized protein n=1 Tax=Glarea lozoyensis (strain ATCC 20868 / MF5171) TaxID=1116229 RepID=S3CY32_GLAL2|nr:uncharacterized protein GLAREA_03487 [Glarea lozoyensis ATCC 20868]EPE30520.1 hypothetical protein GLAREA_03487 [Glarea lozoyensis ATCC 20868]